MPEISYDRTAGVVTLRMEDFLDLLANQKPPTVPDGKPDKPYSTAVLCSERHCTMPRGHIGKHENNTGAEW